MCALPANSLLSVGWQLSTGEVLISKFMNDAAVAGAALVLFGLVLLRLEQRRSC
jgi:hypothetical protein